MAFVSKIILGLTIVSLFFGQLYRLEFNNISFPLIDALIPLLFLINIIQKIKTKTLVITNKYLFAFIIFAWISFIINLFFQPFLTFKPLLYLLRLTFLLSFFVFPLNLDTKFQKLFNLVLISNIIFGFIQYTFWPNLIAFKSLDWDPHTNRLVSTFLDPTFTGLIYLFFIIFLFFKIKSKYKLFILILPYIAMALTYSRSTILAFILSFTFIAYKLKNIKIFLISILIFSFTIILLPRLPGESTKLERTSSIKAKIENYKEGLSVYIKSPIVGHGYNNLSLVRQIKDQNSHANNGFDSSLITILTTTGFIGFILFLLSLKTLFLNSNLMFQTLLISVLIHSLFANSLLYTPILFYLVFIKNHK